MDSCKIFIYIQENTKMKLIEETINQIITLGYSSSGCILAKALASSCNDSHKICISDIAYYLDNNYIVQEV